MTTGTKLPATSVKEHYDQHLGTVYAWMMGDFTERKEVFRRFLEEQHIAPAGRKTAVDLGAGHGIQSIALAESGFDVIAVDFSRELLDELEMRAQGMTIRTVDEDIRNLKKIAGSAELVVCCGDTLSHLGSWEEINALIADAAAVLEPGGRLLLSFRDYSVPLQSTNRIIPVKSDDNRILTCILDYEDEYVWVTDLLHERTPDGWQQKASQYRKVRITTVQVLLLLHRHGLTVTFDGLACGMTTVVAQHTEPMQ